MNKLYSKKILVTASILSGFFSLPAVANDTLTVAPHFYHIDHRKHLIIINRDIQALNAESPTAKSQVVLDKHYTFAQPTTLVSSETSYQVKAADSTPYTVYFSSLPIVHITSRSAIVNAPSVYAKFSMTEPSGAVTTGNMGIEMRGATAQSYPKKSYELSMWADTAGATDRDVRLLNMRTDNKWNLQALYNEPLRVNSKVAYELWQDMQQLYYKAKEPDAKNGISLAYVEVFLNDEYQGLYTLGERVDRKQLKLKKYSTGQPGELYKGVLAEPPVLFTGLKPFDNTKDYWAGFEYKEPQDKIDWTNLYKFIEFVRTSSDQEFNSQYQKWFRLDNAVDYYILLNLVRATDNTGKNLYIAKYKQGEPYYYVPWDMDGTFGNEWQGLPNNVTNDLLSNGFYDRLMQDCSATGFRATLRQRWTALRQNVLKNETILAKINTYNNYLLNNNNYAREHVAWKQFTYNSGHLTYMTTWLKERLAYLDGAFSQPCSTALATTSSAPAPTLALYPNPTNDYLTLAAGATPHDVCIRDLQGKVVLHTVVTSSTKLAVGHLARGLYVATIKNADTVKTQKLQLN
jgi:spore coat protein H